MLEKITWRCGEKEEHFFVEFDNPIDLLDYLHEYLYEAWLDVLLVGSWDLSNAFPVSINIEKENYYE